MLSHGIVSGALFLIVGVVYDRLHSRDIDRYGGLVHRMPVYAAVFMLFMLASVGLPGTSGFIGEFLVMVGAFQVNNWVATLICTGIILGAAYMLWLYRRVIFGKLEKADLMEILDLSPREIAVFAPLVLIVLWMGIYPTSFTAIMAPSVDRLLGGYQTALPWAAAHPSGGPPAGGDAMNWLSALPRDDLLAGAAMALLMFGVFLPRERAAADRLARRAGLVAAMVLVIAMPAAGRQAFAGLFVVDRFAHFMKLLVLGASALSILLSLDYVEREHMARFEFPVLMLFATLGMMLMISANDLISLYLGLELQSLRALRRRRLPARFPALDRGGAEIFRSRRALLGHAALRRLDDLRLRRHHRLLGPGAGADQSRGAPVGLIIGLVFLVAGPGLQGLGRALPHVDAGRL